MSKTPLPLWDLPTRVFHWSIVCCLPLAWWSAETDNYDAHEWIGYTVITLVLFRVVWGFLGSGHSRFRDFVVGPRKVVAYLKGSFPGSAGHNPLGGWSVLALLSLLLLQAVSGLFNSDDVLFSGPLYYAASVDLRDAMGVVHELAFDLLLGLVALHIMAVLYHQLIKRERLIGAMIRGRAEGRDGTLPQVHWWKALLTLALVALALWWGLEQAPQPAPIVW
jgi:cytochrome b